MFSKSIEDFSIEEEGPFRDTEERYNKLYRALARLPKEERDIIEKTYFKGVSLSKMSEKLGISRSAVFKRRRSGLKKLRGLLLSPQED